MSSFGRLVCSVAEWVPRSIVFASGMDSVSGPLANEEVVLALLLLALLPLALPWGWVCFGDLAGAAFHLGVSMRWSSTHGGLASGSSESLASRFERLVSLQGASDSMPHFSPEGVVVISGFWHSGTGVAPGNVLPLTMVIPLAPGRICPSLPFPDGSLSLRCLF